MFRTMSVYTELTHADISAILADYSLGTLTAFEGIAAGIENSNFFIHTQGENSRTLCADGFCSVWMHQSCRISCI